MNTDRNIQNFDKGDRKNNVKIICNTTKTDQMPVKRSTPYLSMTGRKRRKKFSLSRLIIPTLSLFLAYFLLSTYLEARLRPQIRELAQAQAEKHLMETVNREVGNMADQGLLTYESMVKTIRDSAGEVIYLEVDTAMLAGAKARLVEQISKSLEENKKIRLSVPLGSLSGWNLFSGLGFPVSVRIWPIGSAEGEVYTELEDCGINQTRHMIQIRIHTKLYLVLPGENTTVDTEVTLPLGERVLVGDVPEIYLDTLGIG